MENRNIYKLDDVMLILSSILLVPAVFFAWPWLRGVPEAGDLGTYLQTAPAVIGPQILYVYSYLAGAVLTQLAGRYLRYQEKLSLKILDEVGYSRKVRISELTSRLGMSEQKIVKLVKKLSRVSSLNIDLEGDRITRSRKSPVEARPVSGSQVNETLKKETVVHETRSSVDVKVESKGSTQDLSALVKEMRKSGEKPSLDKLCRIAEKMEANSEDKSSAQENAPEKAAMPFGCLTMGILIVLFMTPLWPIPLIIFIRKAVKQRGMSQKEET